MSNKNQSLQELLTERVALFAESGKAEEIIDAGVKKLFTDVIDDTFRSYGEMGKAMKEAVAKALPGNISDMFELTRYNTLIANSLRTQWESSGVENDMLRRSKEVLDQLLKDEVIPERVYLSELLEEFIKEHKEQAVENQWEHPEVRIQPSEYGGMRIFFDKEPNSSHQKGHFSRSSDRSEWSLDNHICVQFDKNNPEKDAKGNTIGKVYAAKINDNPIGKEFSIRGRWQRLLAGLYFGAAMLVIDCDEDQFSYGIYD
ncbi:MAG: hypothetical protein V4607_01885 [Pseudomonadota bacterium]